jgi:two-component system, LytTR family, sensor kinase
MLRNTNVYRMILHCVVVLIFAVALPLLPILYGKNPPFRHPGDQITTSEILVRWAIFSSCLIPFYFTNTYYLVPKYLVGRRYALYGVFVAICFLSAMVVSKILEYQMFALNMITAMSPIPAIGIAMSLLLGMGTSFEMVLQWEAQRRKHESIEKEKISAELSFLKSQVNPHFLFNTLNNIYSLAERNSSQTGQSILLLSNLMRYVLYEASLGKILLTKEIKHLEEYIALNRLRIVETEKVSITFVNKVSNDRILIEPLIFISFIENAFKHGISYSASSFITVELSLVEDKFLVFKVMNSKKPAGSPQLEQHHSGIGIYNTRRRLELLYPQRHHLDIMSEKDLYSVRLTIRLESKYDLA